MLPSSRSVVPSSPASGLPRLLTGVWQSRWAGTLISAALAVLAGLLVSRVLPRGPLTTPEALGVMGLGLGVGLVAGLTQRSRWALLLAPLATLVAYELGRPELAGPTVGAVNLHEVYGLLALLLGRGVHGLLSTVPMVFGVSLGLLAARRWSRPAARPAGRWGWGWPALGGLATLGLAGWLLVPARTPPILGPNGQPLPGSIATLERVTLGSAGAPSEQTIMIRAHSADRPVLLYLSGGPGQSDLAWSRVMFQDLTRDFVVVSWDQRGTGKSYASLDPTSSLTLEQAVQDTLQLSRLLIKRFDERRVYLLGESWGSILGVLAVQREPELFHAFIGSGQMVSPRETDRQLYRDVLALTERTGDAGLKSRMMAYGEPPYRDIPYANAAVMGQYEALYRPYTPPQAYLERGRASGLDAFNVMGSEYSLIEKVDVLRGLIDMFTVMYPQLQGLDLRRDVQTLEVPVYVLDGAAELPARRDLAREWFAGLQAPHKQLLTLEHAGHSVAFEEFGALGTLLTGTVVPDTYRAR